MNETLNPDTINSIPAHNRVITFDGERSSERILIIISGAEDESIREALTEPELLNRKISSILKAGLLAEDAPKMISLGGNFRDMEKKEKTFRKYTGNGYIYKEYNFEVQK